METNVAKPAVDGAGKSGETGERRLGRLADLFRRRGAPAYRMAPPLRNPQYVGLHIAVASSRGAVR